MATIPSPPLERCTFLSDETGVWMEIQKLVASDRSQDSYFGNAVAIEDERLIIGSFRHEPSGEPLGSNYGAAYVFEKIAGQWQEVDKLTAPDAAPGDIFGFSVGLSGDTILIGTYTEGEDENGTNTVNNSGSVYVYERTGNPAWTFAQKLKASDREVGDEFGYALSIINNTALISAHKDDHVVGTTTYGDAGSAYLFKKNTSGVWQESQKLTASDFDTSDDFAHSVSLGSGYLVIGARFEDEDPNGGNTLTSAGSAYIFEEDGGGTWQEIQKIVAGDRDEFDGFATLVAISGTTICLGAPTEDEDASGNNPIPEAGAAYFFSGGTLGIPLPETPTMTVWPNPTSREVWITFQQAPQEVTVTQMGVDGKHMASEVFYTTASVPFSLRGADGLYLLRVTASNGATQTVRIIKKQ
ncbi:MAG: T9SS type A sorting domain-containing protein [Flavobacteriaceae bacterium]